MKNKWNEMKAIDKVIITVRILTSIAIIVLASLQLLGVWKQAINLAIPLMGVVLILQAVQEWKEHRGVAILSLCAALFIFVCAVVVWFAK